MDKYEPFEPYEFDVFDGIARKVIRKYRCFRGQCAGRACYVADRNTHNQFHNLNKS